MPRQARLDIPGLVYHVMARGIERRNIFDDDADKKRFISRLGEIAEEGGAQLYAWSLLSNHFHLLIRRGERPLSDPFSKLMRRLMTSHAVRYNMRHTRSGRLFQNRYKSIVVEEEAYLTELVRYIHLNPVRARMVKSMEELDGYEFTGHSTIMGAREAPWQNVDEVLARFGTDRNSAKLEYRKFVAAGFRQGAREELRGGGLIRSAGGLEQLAQKGLEKQEAWDERILGSGEFVEAVWRAEGAKARPCNCGWESILKETAEKWSLKTTQILGASRGRLVAKARREFLLRAVEEAGLSMAEAGRVCGISHVSAQRAVSKARQEQEISQ